MPRWRRLIATAAVAVRKKIPEPPLSLSFVSTVRLSVDVDCALDVHLGLFRCPSRFFWGGQVGPFTKNTDSTASDSMFSFDYDYFFATLSLRSNLFFCSLVARLFSAFFFCVGLCVPGAFLSVLFVFFCFHFVVFFSSHTKCSSSPPPTVFLSEGGPVTSGMCRPKCNRR